MFTEAPVLRKLERIMQQIPNFAPRGYGVMALCEHENTGRGKNIRCKLERCVCIRRSQSKPAQLHREKSLWKPCRQSHIHRFRGDWNNI